MYPLCSKVKGLLGIETTAREEAHNALAKSMQKAGGALEEALEEALQRHFRNADPSEFLAHVLYD